MTTAWLTAPLGRAFDHSVTGRVCRRLFGSSLLVGAVRRSVGTLLEMRRRMGVGFADPRSPHERALAADRMAMVFDRSWIVRTLEWHAAAIAEGARRSVAARWLLNPLQLSDRAAAFRTAGASLLWAVVAHTAVFAWLDVAVTARGWIARLVVATLGAAMIVRPGAFARGWSGSASRRTVQQATGHHRAETVDRVQD